MPNVQPIVLVGGRSRRFGRDKLREPWIGSEGGSWLVDQPRLALRAAVGGAVWAVGACDPEIAGRFDLHLPDERPDGGPIGGIVAALRRADGPIVVLSGDLPTITADAVRAILGAAADAPNADAVLASAGGDPEPCIGVYRTSALRVLGTIPLEGRTPGLHRLLKLLDVAAVPLPGETLRNANTSDDLPAAPPISHSPTSLSPKSLP